MHTRSWRHLRWVICGLLFWATTVNYIDRQVISILKPTLMNKYWDEKEFGWIIFSFSLAYALMMPVAGRLIDWLGTRLGYLLAVLVWSVAAMAHAMVGSAFGFGIARFLLGVGEAANFPGAIRTVADWFPRRERALATGIFNSGSNVGIILAALLVPFLTTRFGWQSAFLVTGAIGFTWVLLWLWLYRQPSEHPHISKEELALILSDTGTEKVERVPYRRLLEKREMWVFLVGKFLTDPVWWFYLFWFAGYLADKYGLSLIQLSLPLVVVYVAADVGSVGGGWLSSGLLKRGWALTPARKAAMLTCALAVTPVTILSLGGSSLWVTVALVSLAAAAHQGWSANLFTLASDMFPRAAVGSVVGLGGMGGAIGMLLVSPSVGYWLNWAKPRWGEGAAYAPLFLVAGSLYLIALLIIHLMLPRIERVEV